MRCSPFSKHFPFFIFIYSFFAIFCLNRDEPEIPLIKNVKKAVIRESWVIKIMIEDMLNLGRRFEPLTKSNLNQLPLRFFDSRHFKNSKNVRCPDSLVRTFF